MKMLNDAIDFDAYFADQVDESAKIRPAAEFVDAVIDRFFGQGKEANWTPLGYQKTEGKFDIRPGEMTIWAGINGHGKTTYLSNIMLNLMQAGHKVCLMSLEMSPAETMSKMVRQAAGTGSPSIAFIKAFHAWTDGKLWIYNHLGRVAPSRALAVATYARKEIGVDHVVIDSLMKCSAGVATDDYSSQRDFVDSLCVLTRDTGLSAHLVCHMRKGENERTAPGKFDVKGAGEITDLVDNLLIVCMNLKKPQNEDTQEPDAFVMVAKQRHHAWLGSFAFWFDKGSQQFCESKFDRPRYMNFEQQ